jgi:hypothetical protein
LRDAGRRGFLPLPSPVTPAVCLSANILLTMSVSVTAAVAPSSVREPILHGAASKIDSINSINDLIVYQAQTIPNTPLIAYSEHGSNSYVDYTAKDLDQFADEAAKELSGLGLRPKVFHSPSN